MDTTDKKDMPQSPVRVRMAPSPTGNLHLGTAYSTLFNYLFAKKNNGTFVLRLEDTDQDRSKNEFEENIINGLRWLGLAWDEFYKQSDRLPKYQEATQQLLAEGKAYYCFCTTEELDQERKLQIEQKVPQVYSGKCRKLSQDEVDKNLSEDKHHVVRFKMPDNRGDIEWEDLLHGKVSFNSDLLGDMVIMRANGMPLYNFAVVVDDIDMGITHVLRGDDHLSNTPKQIVIFEALEAKLPQFAHWPMILNPDRIGKLSKRQGATSVDDYRKDGFLPEAIVNYMALLGWTMPDDKEIMSLREMVKFFDISKMRLSGAAFNIEKFEWINGEYIRDLTDEELTKRLQEYLVDHPNQEKIAPLTPLVKSRIKTLADFIPLTDFIFEQPEYDINLFKKLNLDDVSGGPVKILEEIAQTLESMQSPWCKEEFENNLRELATRLKVPTSGFFQLIRLAVSGQLVTPPLFESIEIIGQTEIITRIKKVIKKYPNFDFQG